MRDGTARDGHASGEYIWHGFSDRFHNSADLERNRLTLNLQIN